MRILLNQYKAAKFIYPLPGLKLLLENTFFQWRTQDFSLGGVSVTSHRNDVNTIILRHHDVTSLAVSI